MEKKKVFKVFATFSKEASLALDMGSIVDIIESDEFERGHDWQIKEFNTKPEAEAYIEGILDANGWSDPNAIML